MQDQLSLSKHFRDAMARFAGHVQIVTTSDGVKRRGVTATACCSVSDNPPTVLACINRTNDSNAIFEKSGNFALNSLSTAHRPLADAFAGVGGLDSESRFAAGEWKTGLGGAPVLTGALASFDCRLVDIKPVATHWILIGEVLDVQLAEAGSALMYYMRDYRSFSVD